MYFSEIAAISTPLGKGGVALIRISGEKSIEIAQKIFRAKKQITDYPERYMIYGDILSADSKRVLDDGLLVYFKAPNSFTGENVVEISCHGGEVISTMVLSAVLESGARLAAPGEFTRRAFINSKITLTRAEGIADLLDAKTDEAALLSSSAARGRLSDKLNTLSEDITALCASLYAYIDYPEEDLQTLSDSEVLEGIDRLIHNCDKLMDTFKTGKAVTNGVPALILGKPNVGKSTFFNAILGEDKAIVTPIPGTTRDIIEYPVKMGRVLLNLADTAGLRLETGDEIERLGINKAFELINSSELIFALFDGSQELDKDDYLVMEKLGSVNKNSIIPVITKSDLPRRINKEEIEKFGEPFYISCIGECSFKALTEKVEKLFISDEAALREGAILMNARQYSHLSKTKVLLIEARENMQNKQKDICSLNLESALAEILETDGRGAGELIINEIFSRFCIGK